MEGAFFLFVIIVVIGNLVSGYVKSVNHVGENYFN